ncbi:hypothetical protein ACFL0O_02290 [Thermodesulfobacteriota bacterium]
MQPMMDEAIILNSVAQARDCLAHDYHAGRRILTTHASVNVYLQEEFALPCVCLSELMNFETIKKYKMHVYSACDEILSQLDREVSGQINQELGWSLNFFRAMYAWPGKRHGWGLYFFSEGLRRALKDFRLDKLVFYDEVVPSRLTGAGFDLAKIIDSLLPGVNYEVKSRNSTAHYDKITTSRNFGEMLKKVYHNPRTVFKILYDKCINRLIEHRYDPKKKTIILFDPLYELSFLKERLLRGYNLVYYRLDDILPRGFKDTVLPSRDVNFAGFESTDPAGVQWTDFVREDIKTDFNNRFQRDIVAVGFLEKLLMEREVALAVWGSPPVEGAKALIFEYLRSRGVPVIGGQHGCLYGEEIIPWHFDSDFDNCDVYLSYGFTDQDLQRCYPERRPRARIQPCGKFSASAVRKPKPVDILFPVTSAMSMLQGGMERTPPKELANRQVAILKYLDGLKDLRIVVKPFMHSTFNNCAIFPLLKKLNNSKVVDYMSLQAFLQKFSPRLVVIEHPSQPLVDCIHQDTEIILMADPINPYENSVLCKLKKRVHFSTNTKETIKLIDLFVEGRLPVKRNNEYYNHYVHQVNREEIILDLCHNYQTYL